MTALAIAVSMILMNAAATHTTDLDLDNAFEHANAVYARAKGRIPSKVLSAWYNGAMQYVTDDESLWQPSAACSEEEARVFWTGVRGCIPAGF